MSVTPIRPHSAESTSGAGSAPETLTVTVGGRDLTLDELAFLNRMTTTGLVLPNVAHELNNALQVVGGLVEMLAVRRDVPADALEKIGRIGAQAARSAAMVRELVAFSRRDQGGVATVDAAKVVDQALSLRRYHLSRARVKVTTQTGDGGPHVLKVDGHHLLQDLVNLIINAEQALEGMPSPALDVHVFKDDDGATVITIDDNAGPIATEVAARACEAFYTTRTPRAVGLGLAVGRALVGRDGGTLDVGPNGDQGTRATLRFA